MLGGGLAERCQENCPPGGKVLGREARLGKKLRNTWGLAKKCWGRTIVRDWMILVEWLRGWSDTFPQLDCFYRICQDKSEENTWELCSEEKGQDSPRPVSVFSGHWEIYGSGGGLVLIPCSGPIGKPTHWLKYLLVWGSHIQTVHSVTWAATMVLDCQRQNLRHVRWAETTLGWLLEEVSSQAAHGPTTQVHYWFLSLTNPA